MLDYSVPLALIEDVTLYGGILAYLQHALEQSGEVVELVATVIQQLV
jgi:hypothetical protein